MFADISDPAWLKADAARRRARVEKAIAQDNFEIDFAAGIRKGHSPYRIPAPDGETWCLAPQIRKTAGNAAGLAPINRAIRKGDAVEAYDDVPNRTYTPDTRKPASQQFLPFVDSTPYGSSSRSDVENADGSLWASSNAAALLAYKQSARTVLPGCDFPNPNHAGQAGVTAGFRDRAPTSVANAGRDDGDWNTGDHDHEKKVAKRARPWELPRLGKRKAGENLPDEVYSLIRDIHEVSARMGALKKAGREMEAAGLLDELVVMNNKLKRLGGAAA